MRTDKLVGTGAFSRGNHAERVHDGRRNFAPQEKENSRAGRSTEAVPQCSKTLQGTKPQGVPRLHAARTEEETVEGEFDEPAT